MSDRGPARRGGAQIIAFVSYGNDSIALLQFLANAGKTDVIAVHSNTGWSSLEWPARVEQGEDFAVSLGFEVHRLPSIGMKELVRSKKGWPTQQFQFCTTALKIEPAVELMIRFDPNLEATCCVGVRRCESNRRSDWPEWTEESERHGFRELWSPLVRHTDEMRDALLDQAGFEPLPTRSQECYPCVNASMTDILALSEERIAEIEAFEQELGHTRNGHLRTIFRPKKKGGAVGIREVYRWACSGGRYDKDQGFFLGFGMGCDSGMCGT